MKIAASILSADFLNLEREIAEIIKAGADILHLDVMDNHYVPNLTFGFPIIQAIRKITSLPLDVHLMVTNPTDYFHKLAEIGIEYISFHPSTVHHVHRNIQVLKDYGIKAGLAINPAETVTSILPVLQDLDFVLLMSVNPGFGGQKFLPGVFEKIIKLKNYLKKYDRELEIEVDGGINCNNSGLIYKKGADILVSGSYIFSSENYKDAILKLRKE